MFERYTEKARHAVFFARHEASVFGSNSIESQHLLLGLFRADPGLLQRLLGDDDVIQQIRVDFEREFPGAERVSSSVDMPLSEECKQALAQSDQESRQLRGERLGAPPIAVGHLLLGLSVVEDSVAARALRSHGFDLASARQSIRDLPETPHTDNPTEPFD